ncbi:hypothetical protein MIND_00170600 [Mycena indigotica]|uniref:Six-hairpin glycosidase n=1 Tax=Mycena indigotica TaxID=2126181 RepID=A0A8H6WF87_9AGAR|nr:uncharacterized protein MIND_00170600 [Mycena indigotica]KAF7316514.1 hypothetical protein MIND_00170600 [Mycena indigotica]
MSSSPSVAGLLHFISAGVGTVLTNASSRALQNPFPFDPGFNIAAVATLAQALPTHSWEYGTAAQMLLETHNPAYSVFGPNPFPVPILNASTIPALSYAQAHISLGGQNGLSNGDGSVGDPASLGVSAVMLAKTLDGYKDACQKEINYILSASPRWPNGAISHRASVPELWADFMYMAPPFIAYLGADTNNLTLLETAYRQSGLYREVLLLGTNSTSPAPLVNASVSNTKWRHIVGPESADAGFWSTGNAWAAAGMARVLATITKAPITANATWKAAAVQDLTGWIKEIVDGARLSPPAADGLLRNYLDDTNDSGLGFGEISGSSMLASVVYRMVVLAPKAFPAKTYLPFADGLRGALAKNQHITSNGTATPAVNPLWWKDTKPWTAGSPEGQSFVVLMYAAWRDCIWLKVCSV